MDNPSAPTAEMLSGGMITIEVGTPPTTFMIHENLAVARSGFFKGALNGHFKESETRKIPIPEDQCDLVACLIHWLYTGTLDLALTMAIESEQKPEQSIEEDRDAPLLNSGPFTGIGLFFGLWILGDKLQIPRFKKDVTKKIVVLGCKVASDTWSEDEEEALRSVPSQETLEFVYENTVTTSPLRRLVTDLFIVTQDLGLLMYSMESLPEEIVRDIGKTFLTLWLIEYRLHSYALDDYLTETLSRGGYTRARRS